MRILLSLVGITVLASALSADARADDAGRLSITQMCKRNVLIIEGKWLGKDRVEVTKVWTPSKGYRMDLEPILDFNHHQELTSEIKLSNNGRKALTTKNMTMFLEFDDHSQSWWILEESRTFCVFWWDDKNCYSYEPVAGGVSPILVAAGQKTDGISNTYPATVKALRKAIEEGLKEAAKQ